MNKILLVVFLSICNSIFALNVEGKIYDENGQLLSGCNVLLMQEGQLLKQTISTNTGEFIIQVKEGEKYSVEIIHPLYKIVKENFETDFYFIEDNSHLEIHLTRIPQNVLSKTNSNNEADENNMEDVGKISSLPEGYKIIDAKTVKYAENIQSGFNVQQKKWVSKPVVDINEFKESVNQESNQSDTLILNNTQETLSYFKDGAIYYGTNNTTLSNEVKDMLRVFALKLNNDENTILNISAFADANNEANVGKEIAKLRLEDVISFLMQQNVEFSKLKVSAIGNKVLKNECYKNVECTEKQHQENRRVVLVFNN